MRIGNMVFVQFWIQGPSNSAAVSFTLPYPADSNEYQVPIRVKNSDVYPTIPGLAVVVGSTVTCYLDLNCGSFATTGDKAILGLIFYKAA